MEASLFFFINGIAPLLFSEVVDDFCQNVFQTLQRHFVAFVEAIEFGPTHIEGGAIQVARIFGGGAISLAELSHGVVGAKGTVHPNSLAFSAACNDGVLKCLTYVVEQSGCFGHQVGQGIFH